MITDFLKGGDKEKIKKGVKSLSRKFPIYEDFRW